MPIVVAADGTTTTVGRPGTLLGVFHEIQTTIGEVMLRPGRHPDFPHRRHHRRRPPYELEPETVTGLAVEAAAAARTADDLETRLGFAVHRVLPIPDRHDDVALVVAHILRPSG